MIGTELNDGACGESNLGIAFGDRDCVLFARNRTEAARYGALLEEMGIGSAFGELLPDAPLGIPIFVTADERERAGEILSAFQTECAWDGDDEEDDFDDEDDDDEDEFFPDDVDDEEFEEEDDDEEDEEDDVE